MITRRRVNPTVRPFLIFLFAVGSVFAEAPRYRIVDLTERAPVRQSEARAVNQWGEVVGFEVLPDFQSQAVYWNAQQEGRLLPRLKGDNSNIAYGINSAGLITGVSQLVTVVVMGDLIRIFYDNKASLWGEGGITNLETLVKVGDTLDLEIATRANEFGVLTGIARRPGETFWVGFLFYEGYLFEMMGFPVGSQRVQPAAINNWGTVAGEFAHLGTHAFRWHEGVFTDLHEHPLLRGVTSRAFDINDTGQIVGEAQFLISHPESPALWEDGVPVNLVGDRFSRPQGVATAINNYGQIVGFVKDLDDLTSPFEGFLIEDSQYLRLLDLLPPEHGWNVVYPFDINDAGWIVGGGIRNGELGHAWALIPNLPDNN